MCLRVFEDRFRRTLSVTDFRVQHDKFYDEVRALSSDLSNGNENSLNRLFIKNGYCKPEITWAPSSRSFAHPSMLAFSCTVGVVMGDDGTFYERNYNFKDFEIFKDHLMILEPTNIPAQWRYTHYGRQIAAQYNRNMRGETTDKFASYISVFFSALYLTAEKKRTCVLSEHEPPSYVFVSKWRRLIVPVYHDNGLLSRFVVLNIPDNDLRAGLEVVPIPTLIVRSDQTICFANSSMSDLLGLDDGSLVGANLEDFVALKLQALDPNSPERLMDTRRQSAKITISNEMLVHVTAVSKAVFYRDQLLHVIAIQPHY